MLERSEMKNPLLRVREQCISTEQDHGQGDRSFCEVRLIYLLLCYPMEHRAGIFTPDIRWHAGFPGHINE